MTCFVILAAGSGTRMGRAGKHLHKALLPLDGRAVLSHQIGLAPPEARVIICTGHRARQVRDYLELAHPDLKVTFVPVPGWNAPGGGPGASLLAASDAIGDDDLIVTSCDTLWEYDGLLEDGGMPWDARRSWAGVAPVPAGTEPERWCRVSFSPVSGMMYAILDKSPSAAPDWAYTGLAMILRRDLPAFWRGIASAPLHGGERQVTGGLLALTRRLQLDARQVSWTDTGDAAAYARAVADRTGYDWAKPGEATWVLPEQGRVVKFRSGQGLVAERVRRKNAIGVATPRLAGVRPNMLAYDYVPGVTGYEAAAGDGKLVSRLLDWAQESLWRPVRVPVPDLARACSEFYLGKTRARLAKLRPGLRESTRTAITHVDWDELASGCVPVTFHGDFNLGNVIVAPDGGFTSIDWREDFAGETGWGDRRYDFAKLAAGMLVHWGNARHGDFAPWPEGRVHLDALAAWLGGAIPHDVQVIAALSLLNCAPLHAPPLDEVLIEHGIAWLRELT